MVNKHDTLVLASLAISHSKRDLKKVNDLLALEISESDSFTIDEAKGCESILFTVKVTSSTSYANNEHLLYFFFDVKSKEFFEIVKADGDSVMSMSVLKDVARTIESGVTVSDSLCDTTEKSAAVEEFVSLYNSMIASKEFDFCPTLQSEEVEHLAKLKELSLRREEHATQKYEELRRLEVKLENKIYDANQKQKKAKTFEQQDKWSFEAKSLEKKLVKLKLKNQKIKDTVKAEFDLAQKSDSLREMKVSAQIASVLFFTSSKYTVSSGEKKWVYLPLYSQLIAVQ